VNVVQSSSGQFKQLITPLPNVKDYKKPQGNFVTTSRGYFGGNSLDFSIASPNFKVFNVYTWPDSATSELGAGTKIIAGTVGGFTINGQKVQAFYCTGSIFNGSYKCKNSGDEKTVPGATITAALAVEATPNDISDNGMVAVTTDGTDSIFHLFNSDNFYKGATLAGFVATADNSHYQRIENLFTFWAVASGKVTVYFWKDNTLTPVSTTVLTNETFGKGVKHFCPVSVQANPLDVTQALILSNCQGDETRVFTVTVSGTGGTLTVTPKSSKSIRSPLIGAGSVKLCALGSEHIIQKLAGNTAISSTDGGDDNTYAGLDVVANLGNDNVDLLCIRGSQNFVIATDPAIAGDQTYAAMFGNRLGNIGNRYHSVTKLTGDLAGFKV
jgi:hypothetical protein